MAGLGEEIMFSGKDRPMKRVFIFGYYGFHNIGDEAILEAIVEEFREILPDVNITVLSYNASETSNRYQIAAVSRNRFWEVIKSIKNANLVMSGGGSILQDVTSSRSLMYYLGIIFLAKLMGKKVAFYGNGFGPILRPSNQWLVKHIINYVDLITVRDVESREVMQQLGIKQPIHVTADAAFMLKTLNMDLSESHRDLHSRKVAISVRQWKNKEQYVPILAACADELVQKGYEIFMIPMQTPSDRIISEEIILQMQSPAKIINSKPTPKEMIGLIAGMDFVIGMRLHSLIFSTIACVPMIGLAYETKITSFLKMVEQPCAGNVETLTLDDMMMTTSEFLENMDNYRAKISHYNHELKMKSAKNTLLIKSFLMEGDSSV